MFNVRSLLAGSWVVGAGLLAACGISEENFPKRYAKSFCAYLAECEKDDFNAYYSGMDNCRAEVEDWWEDDDARCDFDSDQAKDALKAMDEAVSCNEGAVDKAYDEFSKVYECDDVVEVPTTTTTTPESAR